ncbi:PilN domain-containing protein [Moorellaceae bacterium AZ2]
MAKHQPVMVNLLPPEVQPHHPTLFRQRGKVAAVLLLGGVLLLLYLAFLANTWLSVKRLEEAKDNLALYQPQEEEARMIEERINSLRRQKAELEVIMQNRQRWSKLLADLSAALPARVWMTRLEATSTQEIFFTGRTTSLAAVGEFLTALQALSFLKEVELQSVQAAPEDKTILEFTIRAVLEQS